MQTAKQQIKKIAKKHGLDFVILHGSRAKGGLKGPETDVDIAIYRNGGIKADEYFTIYSEMMDVFKGEELDLKTLHRVAPLFRYHVTKDGQLLYGKLTAYNNFKAYAYHRYIDAKPLFALEKHLLEKGLKSLKKSL